MNLQFIVEDPDSSTEHHTRLGSRLALRIFASLGWGIVGR
jgi:hypothetical protein